MQKEFWHITNSNQLDSLIEHLRDKPISEHGYLIQVKTGGRTTKQNSSLWLYLTQLADALNEAGMDQRKVLKESVAIEWNKDSAAKYLWKPVRKAITGKVSTAQLDRAEIGEVYMALSKHMAEKFGLSISFPSNRP